MTGLTCDKCKEEIKKGRFIKSGLVCMDCYNNLKEEKERLKFTIKELSNELEVALRESKFKS